MFSLMMDTLLYLLARAVLGFLQALPLPWVARLGRAGGALFYYVDARHRRVALRNLHNCFGAEKSPEEIRVVARENFRRIGENYCCAAKTAAMSDAELLPYFSFKGEDKLLKNAGPEGPQSCVVAVGHFGNFELYARMCQFVLPFRGVSTYRGLRQKSLNRLLLSLRRRSGCQFFERRTEAKELKAALAGKSLLLGLLADQHAGDHGLRLPFFGRDCSTSAAPAIFALRYGWPLHTCICYRTGLGRWTIEAGDEIPTHENGQPRSMEAISLDVNRVFEVAVRRDPANWFWVHNRWKPAKVKRGIAKAKNPTPAPQSEAEPVT